MTRSRPLPRVAAATGAAAATLAMLALPSGAAAAEPFSYFPAGDLAPGSGVGRADHVVYAPSMRFPLEEGPAFANSQVYSKGGAAGPRGGQCDPANYAYPWRDNYCETRSWAMPLCPSGAGHQGQDLRPPTCEAGKYWVVAAADGAITHVGRYSVYLTDEHGTRYEYLHMSDVQVSPGDAVSRGQRIGRLSNVFGDKTTTIHLHFNLRQFVRGVGTVFVPPYTSLVAAYRELLDSPPEGALEAADCEGIQGWTRDPDAQGAPTSARLYFDGAATDPGVEGYTFVAERHRADLCEPLGACAHGFASPLPRSLLGGEHTVRAYGVDASSGAEVELPGSPKVFSCPLVLPAGVRRPLGGAEALDAWGFSRFWDVTRPPAAALEALPEGEAFPSSPRLVRGDDGAPEVWLIDGPSRRAVADAGVAAAWGLDLEAASIWPIARLSALQPGPALPAQPSLAQGAADVVYVIDTPADPPGRGAASGASSGVGGGTADSGVGGSGAGSGVGGSGAGSPVGHGSAGSGAGGAAEVAGGDNGTIEGHIRCTCGAAGGPDAGGAGARWLLGLLAAAALRRRRDERRTAPTTTASDRSP